MADGLSDNEDLTPKDYDSILTRIVNLISSVFPTWTDFNSSTFGNLIIRVFAFVFDLLMAYQDNQAGESRMITATQRQNMLAHSKLIGFEPASASAATATVSLSIPVAMAGTVTIPAGTVVKTAEIVDPIRFQVLADAIIPIGLTSIEATAENSTAREDDFTSDDTPTQEFTLTATPYLDGSAIPSDGDGAFTEVDNFLDSGPSDRHFTIAVDQVDRGQIRFGNGTNGKIPTGSITAAYKTGGGQAGNVEAGKLTQIEGAFTDSLGTSVTVSVTNALEADNGENRHTVEQIRLLAPQSLRVSNRAVAREDFEIVADTVQGVGRSLMLTSNEDTIAENTGFLYVIPTGGGVPSQTLKDTIAARFAPTGDYPSTLTFSVEIQDPIYLDVNIVATVYRASGVTAVTAGAAIRSALDTFFAAELSDGSQNPDIGFGFDFKDADGNPSGEIAWSHVMNVVRDLPSIRKVSPTSFLLNSLQSDVSILAREFPRLGSVTLTDGDTGASL